MVDTQVPFAPLTDDTLDSERNHNARVAVMHLLDGNVDLAVMRAEKSQAYHDALMGRVYARLHSEESE